MNKYGWVVPLVLVCLGPMACRHGGSRLESTTAGCRYDDSNAAFGRGEARSLGPPNIAQAKVCFDNAYFDAADSYLTAYVAHPELLPPHAFAVTDRGPNSHVAIQKALLVHGLARQELAGAANVAATSPQVYAWYKWRLANPELGFDKPSSAYFAWLAKASPEAEFERTMVMTSMAMDWSQVQPADQLSAANMMMAIPAVTSLPTSLTNVEVIRLMILGLWAQGSVLVSTPAASEPVWTAIMATLYPAYWRTYSLLSVGQRSWLETGFNKARVASDVAEFRGAQAFHEAFIPAGSLTTLRDLVAIDFASNTFSRNLLQYNGSDRIQAEPSLHAGRWLSALGDGGPDQLVGSMVLASNPNYRSTPQTFALSQYQTNNRLNILAANTRGISNVFFGRESATAEAPGGTGRRVGCASRWSTCRPLEMLYRKIYLPTMEAAEVDLAIPTSLNACMESKSCGFYGLVGAIPDVPAMDTFRRSANKTTPGGNQIALVLAKTVSTAAKRQALGGDEGLLSRFAGRSVSDPANSKALDGEMYLARINSAVGGFLCFRLAGETWLSGWEDSDPPPVPLYDSLYPAFLFARLFHNLGVEGNGVDFYDNFVGNVVSAPPTFDCPVPVLNSAPAAYLSTMTYPLSKSRLKSLTSLGGNP